MGLQINTKQMPIVKRTDIVFCIDHSVSMSNCIAGVKATITDFVNSLQRGVQEQSPVDCQIGLVGYSSYELLFQDLTKDIEAFRGKLGQKLARANEFTPGAIDFAISNSTWRMGTQRVVVVFTDEKLLGGLNNNEGTGESKFDRLLQKVVASNVQIIYYGPRCPYYAKFNQCPKAEVNVVEHFSGVSFDSLMERLAITVSSTSAAGNNNLVDKSLVYDKANMLVK